ncbi:MAG: gliding motility-associated C-terminal domain-containing protein, partial [Bacteroidota bacterium]
DCESDCNGTIEIDIIEGGTAPYSFFWSDGSIGQAIGGLCAGEYTVTVTDFEGLTEEFGPYVIEEPTPIELSFLIPGNGTASMTITGGTTPYDIKWNTENSDTTSAVSVSEEGVYAVIVTDANGCTAFNNDVFITIADGNPEGGICSDVRAVITPNDDGQNDEFIIRCSENVVEELRIFNRYGQLVFESDAYDDSWMGTNDRNSDLPEGGYFYVLEYVNAAGQRLQEKGHITIIR